VSALFGFVVLFGMIPMQGFFGKRFGVLRKQMVAFRDDRIRKLSDMLQGIQVLKLYAWELPFQASVLSVREREGAKLRAASWMKVRGRGERAMRPPARCGERANMDTIRRRCAGRPARRA